MSNELISFAAILPPPPVAENLPGKTDHRSTYINSEHKSLRHYDGSHVNVAMGDDRIIGPHIDYKGRIDQSRTSGNDGDHGDHVAGCTRHLQGRWQRTFAGDFADRPGGGSSLLVA